MHFSLPAQLQTATSTAESEASGRMKKDVLGSIKKKLNPVGKQVAKNVVNGTKAVIVEPPKMLGRVGADVGTLGKQVAKNVVNGTKDVMGSVVKKLKSKI